MVNIAIGRLANGLVILSVHITPLRKMTVGSLCLFYSIEVPK